MSEHKRKFEAGYRAFQRKDYNQAKSELTGNAHPQALHLLGIVERRLGNLAESAHILSIAAKKEPQNPEIAHNRGLVCVDQGDVTAAETHFVQAVSLNPDFVAAKQSLARLFINGRRWYEAEALYKEILEAEPDNLIAHHGLGTVELESGRGAQALARFDDLLARDSRPEFYYMRGRSLMELGRAPEAIASLRQSYGLNSDAMTLKLLGNLLWMSDDPEAFEQLLAESRSHPELASTRLELMRLAEMPLVDEMAEDPDSLSVLANARVDAGEAEAAWSLAAKALELAPGHPAATAAQISAALMLGEFHRALALTREKRKHEPLGQHWIAYEAIALKQLDSRLMAVWWTWIDWCGASSYRCPKALPALSTSIASLHGSSRSITSTRDIRWVSHCARVVKLLVTC